MSLQIPYKAGNFLKSLIAELLACQEGLYVMELVILLL